MLRTDPLPQRTSQLERLTDRGPKQPVYVEITQDAQHDAADATYMRFEKGNSPSAFHSVARVWRSWWSELLSAVLLVLSFGGMLAMLRDFQGKPLPKWPLGLSFNTALSLFGAIIRFPALYITAEGIGQFKWLWLQRKRPLSHLTAYDDASRGPWGATKLLWTVRWNDMFAFLGAIITIASLGFDPFTQAVVSYYPCTAPDAGTISYVNHTNSYFSTNTGRVLPTWARLAIDASFSDPSTIKPPITCTASVCSFSDAYHTIGLCSKCVDVTHDLHTNCNTKGCNYTLSSNKNTNSSTKTIAGYSVANILGEKLPDVLYANYAVFAASKYSYAGRADTFRVDTETFGILPHYQSSTIDIVSARPILASRCMLYFCVRSYKASVDHGVMRETLVSTHTNWSNWTDKTPVIGTVELSCLKCEVRSRLLDKGYISPNDEWMPWNSTFLNGTQAQEHISTSDELAIPFKCVYQTQLYDAVLNWDASESFSDSLAGTLKASGDNFSLALDAASSKSHLTTLFNNATVSLESLNKAFDNFTTVATNYMRTLNSPIRKNITDLLPTGGSFGVSKEVPLNPVRGEAQDWNHAVVGEALMDTTCIHVRWPWLALPAGIFVGTLVIMGMLVVKTIYDHDIEVWKSSQNALIWHGLHGSAMKESGMLASKRDMHDRAKEINVQLRQTRMGWKLVQDD
ncbi:hypothetical protein DE146DRAFT_627642 [Phaeosphaeria sp. MPI-PUGE-AT-0046c]|nr:hypothetical protein DE146DRAFT_627642 [Phaeosphaeria sp. MPI-PUGE-AT-0046c]